MMRWLFAFVLTQAIEVPIYRRATGSLWVAFAASALTHPVVWFAFPLLPLGYWPMVVLAEVFAVTVEAWWLWRHRTPHPLRWSLLANACSATLGLVCRACFGVP